MQNFSNLGPIRHIKRRAVGDSFQSHVVGFRLSRQVKRWTGRKTAREAEDAVRDQLVQQDL